MRHNGIPSLRISTAAGCNHRCAFCQLDGDAGSDSPLSSSADTAALRLSIRRFFDEGVRHFSFTGGEPLTKPERTFRLARFVHRLLREQDTGYVRLNTNGTLVQEHVENVASLFDLVKVSLHSLSQVEYGRITGSRHPQIDLNRTLHGIDLLHEHGVPIRIHFVVTSTNVDECFRIIEFCKEHAGITELKVFDVSEYSELWRNHANGRQYWDSAYQPLDKIEDALSRHCEFVGTVLSVGGYGNPMRVYETSCGLRIRLRRSDTGATYSKECHMCPAYAFCRDGHCNLEIGLNGLIKVCRPLEGRVFVLGQEAEAIDHFRSTRFVSESLRRQTLEAHRGIRLPVMQPSASFG